MHNGSCIWVYTAQERFCVAAHKYTKSPSNTKYIHGTYFAIISRYFGKYLVFVQYSILWNTRQEDKYWSHHCCTINQYCQTQPGQITVDEVARETHIAVCSSFEAQTFHSARLVERSYLRFGSVFSSITNIGI